MRRYTGIKKVFGGCAWLCITALCLTSCRDDDPEAMTVTPVTEELQLLVSVPDAGADKRNIGDPGEGVQEGADWDRLAIIVAYADGSDVILPEGSKVMVAELSKEDFDKLPDYDTGGNVKRLTLNAQPGTVYIYGVTYSSDAVNSPHDGIADCRSKSDVEALAISNSYASTGVNTIDYEKFLSVATGYYYDTDVATPAPFEIKESGTSEVGKIPAMTLIRLASKIDIQWDAEDAYTAGYTDVKVTGFQYNGTVAGYLFPGLTHASAQRGYSWDFYNKSDISQRNGRTYHYTFTDGITKPNVTFNITATLTVAGQVNKDYTMSFSNPLKQAAWYKVNTTIRGLNNDGSITVSN